MTFQGGVVVKISLFILPPLCKCWMRRLNTCDTLFLFQEHMSRVLVTRFGERDTLKKYVIWAETPSNEKHLALAIFFMVRGWSKLRSRGFPQIPTVFLTSVKLTMLARV